jgi:predicted transcriptional regulator
MKEATMIKRKPGRPPSVNPRQNVRIRLPQPTLGAIDTLAGSHYADRTAVIEAAIIAFLSRSSQNL